MRIKAQVGPLIMKKKAHPELRGYKKKFLRVIKGSLTLITLEDSLHLPDPKNSEKIPSDREKSEEARTVFGF